MKILNKFFTTASLLAFVILPPVSLHGASVIQFAADTYEVDELPPQDRPWERYATVRITIDPPFAPAPAPRPRITVRVGGGTATNGADFDEIADLVLLPDAAGYFVNVFPKDDGITEPDETVELELRIENGGGFLGRRSKATVIIHNAKPRATISGANLHYDSPWELSDDYRLVIPEGTNPQIEVRRMGDRDSAAVVEVQFFAGGKMQGGMPAVTGREFLEATRRIEFRPGEASRLVPAPILDNGELNEPPARFFAARLSSRTAGLTIFTEEPITCVIEDNELPTQIDVTRSIILEDPFISFTNGAERALYWRMLPPLPGGGKLVYGDFTHVNGIQRPRLARLLPDDELDESFMPPTHVTSGFTPDAGSILVLRSGQLLLKTDFKLVRLNHDGSIDEAFKPPFDANPVQQLVSELEDGSVFVFTATNRILRVSALGSILEQLEIGDLTLLQADRVDWATNLPGGRFLIHGVFSTDAEPGVVAETRSYHRDASPDIAFAPIAGRHRFVLADGRLLVSRDNRIQIHLPDGTLDPSWPAVILGECFQKQTPGYASEVGGRLRISYNVCAVNGVPVNGVARDQNIEFHLSTTTMPKTALQLTGQREGHPFFGNHFGDAAILVVFRRLGPSTSPATVHYTTRDGTAMAGKDYIAQSGVVAFAPLETEKTIQIPILADTEDEFSETFEVVVTGAEGFEALPVPMLLTIIPPSGQSPAPRLNRVKRLRDSRVLLGGTASQYGTKLEYSSDLKSWHPLTNLLSVGSGPDAIWLDASATNAATRYYRAVAR